MNDDEKIIEEINNINWWHTIDLGKYGLTNGKVTSMVEKIMMPDDFTDKSVLDIGAVDGLYSFEAEKRNAKRVLAVDGQAWNPNNTITSNTAKNGYTGTTYKQGFNLARKLLNSKVEDMYIEDFEEGLNVETVGQFDVVLCLGVLYHMKYPFKFLHKLKEMTKETLILETHTDANIDYAWKSIGIPVMAFYPGKELNNDETNWWGPNIPCLLMMLDSVGFKQVKITYISPSHRIFLQAFV